MKLYFVRHGESTTNKAEQYTGQLDVELTDHGREQARNAGRELVERNVRIDLMISSPLIRAHETAQLIAKEIGYPEEQITIEPLVIERYFGTIQGKDKTEVGELNDEVIEKSGAETEGQIIMRAQEFLRTLEGVNAQNVLIVSHNGFGKRLKAVVEHLDLADAWTIQNFENAYVTELGEI